MFSPSATYSAAPSGRIIVLAPGEIPTTDYYVRPRLDSMPGLHPVYLDSLAEHPERHQHALTLTAGAFVIMVRWAPSNWLRFLEHHRERWSGAALLLDDDIARAWRSPGLPARYAARTSGRFWLLRGRLAAVCDRLWVSTPALKSVYPGPRTRVLGPLCFDTEFREPSAARIWSYHATASHGLEIEWLRQVVERVQNRHPDYEFEIFGGPGVRRRYAGIPGVTVREPLSWPAYKAFSRSATRAVGLAPLLDSPFNRARSCVKVFDITRCGAVGIYSDTPPFRGTITHGREGLVLPNDPAAWAQAVETLLDDLESRRSMHRAASEWCCSRSRDPEFRHELAGAHPG